MKLAVIIPVLNQFEIANQCIDFLTQFVFDSSSNEQPYEIIVVDNGSDERFVPNVKKELVDVKVVYYDEPIGSYPVFFESLEYTDADILAFFHSDFFVYDWRWHQRVLEEFEKDSKLGMIGFIGSDEIDNSGGRGLGTRSNFQGRSTRQWKGSASPIHGKTDAGFSYGVVVDGCSMILRRTALEQIGFRENFPPHHFYDRLISTQLLENGWNVGILGIECDHISGQTANQEGKWQDAARKWCESHHITPGGIGTNWDNEIYKEAERQWLEEYKNRKHFIPRKVVKPLNFHGR